jgi:hypothetical protein
MSVLAEMSEVLDDLERQAMLAQLASKPSDPKPPIDNADSTKGEPKENEDDEIIMEDASKSVNKVLFSQETRSPSILRPTRRTPNSGRGGNISQEVSYEGVIHAIRSSQGPAKIDKPITLKKQLSRPHIHRYTLRFKTTTPD